MTKAVVNNTFIFDIIPQKVALSMDFVVEEDDDMLGHETFLSVVK